MLLVSPPPPNAYPRSLFFCTPFTKKCPFRPILSKNSVTSAIFASKAPRMRTRFAFYRWIWMLALVGAGCQTMKPVKPPQVRVTEYETMLVKNPGNPMILRELGVAHFELNQFPQAESYLKDALVRTPDDAKTALYLGLMYEATNRRADAIEQFKSYPKFDAQSRFTRLMEGRYQNLTRELLRAEMAELARREEQGELTNGRIEPDAIAIFPLKYLGQNEQYAALGRGISALMMADMSLVKSIRLLERLQLNVLQDEILRGQTGIVDTVSAPRAGRILGAGKVVLGSYNVSENKRLTVDAGYWDVLNSASDFRKEPGLLQDLFTLEKAAVLRLLAAMGVRVTDEERQKIIGNLPTRNLQAFMAYCRGLTDEDLGNMPDAILHYRRAVDLDPAFLFAQDRLQTSLNRAAAGGDWRSVNVSFNFKASGSASSRDALVSDRLATQGNELGQSLLPSPEKRQPTEEFGKVGDQAELPRPPVFPPKGQ